MSPSLDDIAKQYALVPYSPPKSSIAKLDENADIPLDEYRTEEARKLALSNAERQARWREKHREINENNAVTVAENNAPVTVAQVATPTVEVLPPIRPRWDWARGWNWPLVAAALVLYSVAIGFIVLNALGAGNTPTVIGLAAMGIAAVTVSYFATPMIVRGPYRSLALVTCLFCLGFALQNDFRIASIASDNQSQGRTQTNAVALNTTCTPATTTTTRRGKTTTTTTTGESAGCGVVKANPGQASPENRDFAALIAWVSFGAVRPSEADFAMLWLFFRTLLPQLGGVVLLLARR